MKSRSFSPVISRAHRDDETSSMSCLGARAYNVVGTEEFGGRNREESQHAGRRVGPHAWAPGGGLVGGAGGPVSRRRTEARQMSRSRGESRHGLRGLRQSR